MRPDRMPVPVIERPEMAWGSDAVAELLGQLGLDYIALVPGASYRGLHDSIVNYLGNSGPRIVLCLHEEHAVAIAHGYAKVTGRPMAAALHSNVGLMHATMAIFDAFCDRVPLLLLGATGPVDAARRRPWIDWIHTASDQGALIRNFCKWDDQPASAEAAVESVLRADLLTRAYPHAPTYVCLDAAMQEEALPGPIGMPDLARHQVPPPPAPSPESVEAVLRLLQASRRPLLLAGRVSRSEEDWAARVELAESIGAAVLTDLKTAAAFPTTHRLHPASPGTRVTAPGRELLRNADLIVSLDWIDLEGTLQVCFDRSEAPPPIVSCTCDFVLHNGWSKDHFALPPADVPVSASPDALVRALLSARAAGASFGERARGWPGPRSARGDLPEADAAPGEILMGELAQELRSALGGRRACYTSLSLGSSGSDIDIEGPLDYLGKEGGAGVGAGPGIAVGAALALEGTGRIPVAVLGDGDCLMGGTALWTAAHHRLPLLVVVANNRSYYNDEVHQERMARMRSRPPENRSVGQHLRDPDPDIAGFGRSLGLKGYGPVTDLAGLREALSAAVAQVEAGEAAIVDVRVSPHGYKGASEARPERRLADATAKS